MNNWICQKCNAQNAGNFCMNCGASPNVQFASGQTPMPQQNQPFQFQAQNQPFQQGFNQQMPVMKRKKGGSGNTAAIVGGSLFLVAAIAVGLGLLYMTQTLRWQIERKWKMENTIVNGNDVPLGEGGGATIEFKDDMTFITQSPKGESEYGTWKINNENSISTTDRLNNTVYHTVTINGDSMTMGSNVGEQKFTLNYRAVK